MFPQVPSVSVGDVPEDAMLLDVREPDEWTAGHAPGAVHIPMGDIPARVGEVQDAFGEGPVRVVCKAGGRSAQVVGYLVQAGVDAVNVDGGMQAWDAAGRAVRTDGGEPGFVA